MDMLVSDYIPAQHYVARLTWMYEKYKDDESSLNISKFLHRMHRIDSGMDISKQFVEESTRLFPRIDELTQIAEPAMDNCSVCHEPMRDPIRLTKCNHEFCHHCLDTWARNRLELTCPLCRATVGWSSKHYSRLISPPKILPLDEIHPDEKFVNSKRTSLIDQYSVSSANAVLVTDCQQVYTRFKRHPHVRVVSWRNIPWKTNIQNPNEIVFLDSYDPWQMVETVSKFRKCYLVTRYSIQHFLLSCKDSTNLSDHDFLVAYAKFLISELSS